MCIIDTKLSGWYEHSIYNQVSLTKKDVEIDYMFVAPENFSKNPV
jgi:hypothetical protein